MEEACGHGLRILHPRYPRSPRSKRSILTKEFFGAIEKAFVQRRVFFAAQGGKFFEFLALFAVQSRRDFHQHPREQIAALAAVDVADPFAAQFEHLAALRSGRHFQFALPSSVGTGNFATERRER